MPTVCRAALGMALIFWHAMIAHAQQPFLTDDADMATLRRFHFELLTEHDRLHQSAYPTLRQNTTRAQLTYGVLGNLEVGIDGPLIAIYNASESGQKNAFGLGDLDLQVKYRLHLENEHTPWPAFTLVPVRQISG